MHPEIVLQSLGHVWATLERLKVPMAVTGGLALATWKHVRATRDVDLLVDLGGNNLDQLIEHLRAAGLRPKRTPPVTSLGELDVVQLLYEPPEAFIELQIDLLLAKSEYHREALRRRVPTQLPNLGIGIAVLTCEDLILHKLLAGRLIDRADAAALMRANPDSLDWDYLTRWARELAVTDDLAQSREEAFPSGATDCRERAAPEQGDGPAKS